MEEKTGNKANRCLKEAGDLETKMKENETSWLSTMETAGTGEILQKSLDATTGVAILM